MHKLSKLFLTLALLLLAVSGANATKLYATYGTPANQGTWNAETGTYTWTAGWSNLMPIFTFANGELAQYQSLHLTTANYVDGPYRVCFMKGGEALATITFYSAGVKNLVFAERNETKDLDLSQITTISFGGASGKGSVDIVGKPYLQKPFTLDIDDTGTAVVDKTDLVASGCLTLNDETGLLTSTLGEDGAPTWGRLAINFPAEGVDLSALTAFTVNQSGTVLFSNFEIGSKGFWSNVMGRGDMANYMGDAAIGDATAVTTWRWNVNTAGTQTITGITLKFSVLMASNPHETPLTTEMYQGSCENHFGQSMGQGSTIYGMGNNIDGTQYVDLADYDEMRVYGTPGKGFRVLFNWNSANKLDKTMTLDADGYYSFDLSELSVKQLNCVKFPWDGATGVLTKIVLYKEDVTSPYNYIITGGGAMTPSVEAALADAAATGIDATGVTKAAELTTANPNCLIVAAEGMVLNPQNVIVDGQCARLVLADGYDFKAPVSFTAAEATYQTTVSAAAGCGTLVLPFQAQLPEGITAYTLTYSGGDEATATEVSGTLPAATPVLLNGSGAATFTASAAAVSADAPCTEGALTGVLQQTFAPVGSYVLQNQEQGVGFYQVAKEGSIAVKPFRAYLTAASSARQLRIAYPGQTTAISTLTATEAAAPAYNLQGQRVLPTAKGLYIIDGRKVMVK